MMINTMVTISMVTDAVVTISMVNNTMSVTNVSVYESMSLVSKKLKLVDCQVMSRSFCYLSCNHSGDSIF